MNRLLKITICPSSFILLELKGGMVDLLNALKLRMLLHGAQSDSMSKPSLLYFRREVSYLGPFRENLWVFKANVDFLKL